MKKLLVLLILTISAAQAQCLLCFAVGAAVGSSSSSNSSQVGAVGTGAVIYKSPNIGERLLNPMGVKMGSIKRSFSINKLERGLKGETLWEIFKIIEPAAHQYEVLEIFRVIDPDLQYWATLWFVYVDKKDMRPPPSAPVSAEANPSK